MKPFTVYLNLAPIPGAEAANYAQMIPPLGVTNFEMVFEIREEMENLFALGTRMFLLFGVLFRQMKGKTNFKGEIFIAETAFECPVGRVVIYPMVQCQMFDQICLLLELVLASFSLFRITDRACKSSLIRIALTLIPFLVQGQVILFKEFLPAV